MRSFALPATSPATEEDWLRRGTRALWFRAPWVLAGSVPILAAALAATSLSGGYLLVAAALAGLVGAPAFVALAVIAQRLVLDGDVRAHDLRTPGRGGWARAVAVVWTAAAAVVLALVAFEVYGRTGSPAALVPALAGTVVAAHAVLLAPAAVALLLDRPSAPWRNVWIVAFLAAARRPVPVLGGWVAAALLCWLALRLQVLLLVVPGVAAVVLVSAAWTALGGLGVTPGRRTPAP
ncbi:hypothetical protein [Jiangella rhizosphaerae]|uniref:DUF624 domain-containing protein n=1 Tax=Jiangella rhizosphaerae TaxID=2293569 RepID=A0A418KRT7_9ACTN|nr:hypothetical protein [Jiangella rhizosphaerae]RIQ25890.1 hypothetical protein DY240_11110 [Jiangella rhizosphaerae]